MGQQEVINFLLKQNKPLSRGQIADGMNECAEKISHILKKLLKGNDIKCFELDRYKSAEFLGMKHPRRRIRFYYCFTTQK